MIQARITSKLVINNALMIQSVDSTSCYKIVPNLTSPGATRSSSALKGMIKLVTSGNKVDESHRRERLQKRAHPQRVLQQHLLWLCQLAGVNVMRLSKQYFSFFADDVLVLDTADPNTDLTPLPYAYIPIKGE